MHSSNVVSICIIGISLIAACWANNDFQTKYEWKTIDFNYETAAERQEAINNKMFIPPNVIPVGLDVHENRLFLSLPRLKHGVPASLAYINMNEMSESNSPVLKPYPSWQAHRTVNANDSPDIVSPFHIKVDRCNRLWALDSGIDGILNESESKRLAPPRILIFDLLEDNLKRQITLKTSLNHSIFSNIVVDDSDCDDTFAYVADAGTSTLTVYSDKANESWEVNHNFFSIDPLAGDFNILGVSYRTQDGLYGLALTEKKENGHPDLYFHALTSNEEFNVSTSVLRNKSISDPQLKSVFYKNFTHVGSRGTNGQAGATVYDPTRKIFFYTLPNMNEIACWKTNKNYSISNVFSSPVKMVYPIDIKINKDRLWVLSNNLQHFLKGKFDAANDKNFYIQFSPIKQAIHDTPCEPGFVENVVNKFNKALRDGNGSIATKPATLLTFIASIVISVKQLF